MTVAPIEETAVITLTTAAADKLFEIMNEKGVAATHALRVFVSGGGCSGLQYGMTFDDNPRPVDTVFEQHGLRVVVDPRSLPYLVGANIDYVDTPMGSGFQIDNPNAVSTCGCGSAEGGCSSCR
ncbi:MAG: iron-sulfur cluster insertion protein ErpA [Anaerolineae bacterium]